MTVYINRYNSVIATNDWISNPEKFDYYIEIARSSFADMLHDTERNKKYEAALKLAIDEMHSKGKDANVLDIGTGTGLLSMMAARHGADRIVACEAFRPMSECARHVIQTNGYEDRIQIIPKRSLNIIVGEDGDMKEKCNILVTEVFDTELIGEDAIITFKHAHAQLMETDCIVIPKSANIYAQVVESELISSWNKLKDIVDYESNTVLIKVPTTVKSCPGASTLHDIQLNQLDTKYFNGLIPPVVVFKFDWTGKKAFLFKRSTVITTKVLRSGVANGVLVWWDLEMADNILLSCAPAWAHPKPDEMQWRDHWMQSIYYLPNEIVFKDNDELTLISNHDQFSLWFNLCRDLKIKESDYLSPICLCGLNSIVSRTRMAQLNDVERNMKYVALFKKYLTPSDIMLVLSDCSIICLTASKYAKKIYYIQESTAARRILKEFVRQNNICNVEIFETVDEIKSKYRKEKVSFVFSEPYFSNTVYPWDNLMYLHLLRSCQDILDKKCRIFPKRSVFYGIAVNFENLHKIRLPVGVCEDFNLNDFDKLIKKSNIVCDDNIEVQPLWEYPGIAVSEIFQFASIGVTATSFKDNRILSIKPGLGGCNGIAIWVEWLMSNDNQDTIKTGPVEIPEIGKKIVWNKNYRQGVTLFPNKDTVEFSFEFSFGQGFVNIFPN